MSNHFIEEIISGGQTGVDRAALDVAIKFNIPHNGWCPQGRKAEDGVISEKYNLKEAPAPQSRSNTIYSIRTELNVQDSDGTLIILKGIPTGGTAYTIKMAKKHRKPYLIFNLSEQHQIKEIVDWIEKNNILRLNVAGPRASKTSDIYSLAYSVLEKLLKII